MKFGGRLICKTSFCVEALYTSMVYLQMCFPSIWGNYIIYSQGNIIFCDLHPLKLTLQLPSIQVWIQRGLGPSDEAHSLIFTTPLLLL